MKLVCGIYALIIVVLGVVFAVATSLTAIERVHRYYLEVGLGEHYSKSEKDKEASHERQPSDTIVNIRLTAASDQT